MRGRRFRREVAAAGLPPVDGPGPPVEPSELAGLPEPAARWLRAAGVVGRPRARSLRARLRGRFRPAADAPWQRMDATQYNSAPPAIARIFHMRLRIRGIPVQGRDLYREGRGRMVIRPLDLFTVQDGRGREFDLGELVTWLNDAVMLAPSMLLCPAVRWSAVDDRAFDIELSDRGNRVRARVSVGRDGTVTGFVTDDRWYAEPRGTPVRTRWSTPVDGWQPAPGGRMLPTTTRATWLRPEGDHTYAEVSFTPGDVAYDLDPGAV